MRKRSDQFIGQRGVSSGNAGEKKAQKKRLGGRLTSQQGEKKAVRDLNWGSRRGKRSRGGGAEKSC